MPLNGGRIQIGQSKVPLTVLNSYESRTLIKGRDGILRKLDNVTIERL